MAHAGAFFWSFGAPVYMSKISTSYPGQIEHDLEQCSKVKFARKSLSWLRSLIKVSYNHLSHSGIWGVGGK